MHICKQNKLVENDALPIAFDGGTDGVGGEIAGVELTTPADLLIEKEETNELNTLINQAQLEVVRRVLVLVFGESKKPKDALITLALLCYICAPHLLKKNDLASIAKDYGTTKQVLNYRLRKINDSLGLRARNQKSDDARASYSEHRKAWHAARKAEQEALADEEAQDEAA
jgi:hypothetical protein